jgi:uncharacterized repeat protein (TIGR03803 family)
MFPRLMSERWKTFPLWIAISCLLLASPASSATKEKILHSFRDNPDGAHPYYPLVSDASGNLYGTTANGGSAFEGDVFMLSPNETGWKYRVIYTFTDCNSACYPYGSLSPDNKGNLYGTTRGGGVNNAGTVFQLTPGNPGGWVLTVLYGFGASLTDAQGPNGIVYFNGGLYGTTANGGKYNGGTVFSLTPNSSGGWSETILHSFRLDNIDGNSPGAGVTFDALGRIYGTTSQGGTALAGTIFQLTPTRTHTWSERILHEFNGNDGSFPSSGLLVFDSNGDLYGSNLVGGTGKYGTVFELVPSGSEWILTVLHSFTGGQDGSDPNGVSIDSHGRIFGTTFQGGGRGYCSNPPDTTNVYCGTAFLLTPESGSWNESFLHRFSMGGDGGLPAAGVILDSHDDAYGVTTQGGNPQLPDGVVFELLAP